MLPLLSNLSLNDTGGKSFTAELKERQKAAKKAAAAFLKERDGGVKKPYPKPKPASKPPNAAGGRDRWWGCSVGWEVESARRGHGAHAERAAST